MPEAPARLAYPWPVAVARIRRGLLSHTFGPVRRNSDGSRRNHQGWDFEAHPGTPVLAVADGKVFLRADSGAYGNQAVLVLDKPAAEGVKYAFYGHLDAFLVKDGAAVKAGDVIGHAGTTGNARGLPAEDEHLHFEARTVMWAGLGLEGRVSPGRAFGWKAPLSPEPGQV